VEKNQHPRETAVRSLERLIVWQRSLELVEEIYRLTKLFPEDERFGLVSQLRRSAVSIPSNIAEGHARNSRKEFLQFLGTAYGSSAEVYTQLVVASRVRVAPPEEFTQAFGLLDEAQRMLASMLHSLRQKV